MSRTGRVIKRKLPELDPIYGSRIITRFINKMMKDGKKSVAQKQFYNALEIIKTKIPAETEITKWFEAAINNAAPKMEVKPRRVGGASYQVPTEVRGERKIHLAMKWLITAARKRSNKENHTFAEKLAGELLDASNNLGEAIKKRDQTHKMAEANKAFAHFRW